MAQSKRHPARRPQQRGSKRPHPSSSRSAATPPVDNRSEARRRLERRSVGFLAMLHRLPRWVVPLVLAALLLLGLLLPSRWAGILLLAVAAFLGWLLALSWPLVDARGKALRGGAVLLVLLAGIGRLLGAL